MPSPASPKQIPANVLATGHVTSLSRAVLKRDRSVPVPASVGHALRTSGFARGLPRGSVCAVTGVAPVGFAAVLLVEANRAGSWVAWCSGVTPNVRALHDVGWRADRLVCINPQREWLACMGACIGQFELVVTQVPSGVSVADVRRMAAMVARGNGVVVLLVPHGVSSVSADFEFRVERCEWPTSNTGHLSTQVLHVVLGGRRIAEPRAFEVALGVP